MPKKSAYQAIQRQGRGRQDEESMENAKKTEERVTLADGGEANFSKV